MVYVLPDALWRLGLAGTKLAEASRPTIRLEQLKTEAMVWGTFR